MREHNLKCIIRRYSYFHRWARSDTQQGQRRGLRGLQGVKKGSVNLPLMSFFLKIFSCLERLRTLSGASKHAYAEHDTGKMSYIYMPPGKWGSERVGRMSILFSVGGDNMT